MRRFAAIWFFLLSALMTLAAATVWMERRQGQDCGSRLATCYDAASGMPPWVINLAFGALVALGLASTLYWTVQMFRRERAS